MDSLSVINNPSVALGNARQQISGLGAVRSNYRMTFTPSSYDALYVGQNAVEQVNELAREVGKSLTQIKSILDNQQNALESLAKRQGLNLDTLA